MTNKSIFICVTLKFYIYNKLFKLIIFIYYLFLDFLRLLDFLRFLDFFLFLKPASFIIFLYSFSRFTHTLKTHDSNPQKLHIFFPKFSRSLGSIKLLSIHLFRLLNAIELVFDLNFILFLFLLI